jgi:hypothetical protein
MVRPASFAKCVAKVGLEPTDECPTKPGLSRVAPGSATQNPTQSPSPIHSTLLTDPDLAAVAAAWPTLPEALRRAVLALIGAAGSRKEQ